MFGELWDSFKRAIVPESHAESLVNEIYGEENRGVPAVEPKFYPAVASLPKQVAPTVGRTIEIIGGTSTAIKQGTQTIALYVFGGLIVLAAVYGFFGRR